ncbi:hypothetical protein Tco_1019760 [Tanacetum coccineum]|uniref:DUF4219 domain-containing protein n=1 Tax=Tanacetum coccineum TaxID=301880 RepID=A0ABQ5FZI3_9ASTR
MSVNDTLTAELERYKEQVKVLKEGQNVDFRSNDNVSKSSAQSVEIDRLKQTLSEHLKEKESLMQTVSLLKDDFKKEESRNIDREIALEKRIKQLDNIKAQQLEPKLYVGNVIEKTNAIVIPDSEETLLLAEESRSKMLLKQKDPMMLEKKVNTTPVDYANLVNSPEPNLSSRPTIVEVLNELPKVSMVNTSLKKLKHYLAGFDVVVKERTTPTAIIEGSWGFEHTKAYFRDEIIPFVKVLKDLFNTFNQHLVDELSEVQNIFYQMEQAVEQHRLESKTFNAALNVHECEKCLKLETELQKDFVEKEIYDNVFKRFTTLEKHYISLEVDTQLNQEIFQRENSISNQSAPSFDQLFELNELKAQSQEKDTVKKKLKERIKALSGKKNEDKIKQELEEIETINIELDYRVMKLIAENEHLKQTYKHLYDSIKPARIQSKEQCDDLINQVNIKSVEISDLNACLQKKVLVITALKNDLRKLKGKNLADNAITKHTIDPEMLKIDVEYLNPREIVEQGKSQNPLNTSLDSACKYTKQIQELLVLIGQTCPRFNISRVKPSTSASGSQPSGNIKKDKIRQNPSSTQKNKVEAHPRKCNGCMLSDNHDLYVLDFINNVNARKESKSVNKSSKSKVWKPTRKVFSNIGYIWRPTGRTFTIVGNACPLTRITTTTEVPLRKSTALDNETSKLLDRSMDSDKYLEGQSMQRPPLFESDSFIYWKNRFETYVKSKDLDLWHVITNGDFQPIIQNPETKLDEVIPFEKQTDDLKKRLAKNNEAKMVIYNALPRKEYERIFMCYTAKEIWKTLLITHLGNSQVNDNKIDLLVQQYEQFVIFEDESIDNAFARFNTIITSLKALDEGYSSKNYVRKFIRALHPKWRAKVTAIEESKDLTSLSLDEQETSKSMR